MVKGGETATLLVKIGGIILALPKTEGDAGEQARLGEDLQRKNPEELTARANQLIDQLESTTRDLATKKSDLELNLGSLSRYEKIIEKIQPLESQLPVLEGFEVTVLLVQKEFREVLEYIQAALREITKNQFELHLSRRGRDHPRHGTHLQQTILRAGPFLYLLPECQRGAPAPRGTWASPSMRS